jgi:hypothetical protein
MIHCSFERLKDITSGNRVARNNGTMTAGEEVIMTHTTSSKQTAPRRIDWVNYWSSTLEGEGENFELLYPWLDESG